jgi:hypothetical protein
MKYKLFIAASMFFSVGCATYVMKATTTHEQVMNGFKTKDQVIKKFGLPSTKKNEGEYEEWYYDYGTKTVTDGAAVGGSSSNGRVGAVGGRTYSGNPAVVAGGSSNSRGYTQSRVVTQELKSFVKFTLKGDNILLWDTKGVDYGIYEKVRR